MVPFSTSRKRKKTESCEADEKGRCQAQGPLQVGQQNGFQARFDPQSSKTVSPDAGLQDDITAQRHQGDKEQMKKSGCHEQLSRDMVHPTVDTLSVDEKHNHLLRPLPKLA